MSSGTASPTSSSASPSSSGSDSWGGGGGSPIGAATWYGAIALCLVFLIGVGCASRIMYRRRARARFMIERQAATRRGEGPGLPTYGETTFPPSGLSYLTSLRRSHTATSTPSAVEAGIVPPPPAYGPSPPKYEEAGLSSPGVSGETAAPVRRHSGEPSAAETPAEEREMGEMSRTEREAGDLGRRIA